MKEKFYTMGIDVGGSYIKAVLVEYSDYPIILGKQTEKIRKRNPADVADEIVNSIYTTELAEQHSMNLLDKLDFALEKCKIWINSDNDFVKITGFIMLSRLAMKKKEAEDFNAFFEIIENHSKTENFQLAKSIARALLQIGNINENYKEAAVYSAREINNIDTKNAKYIAEEVISLLSF